MALNFLPLYIQNNVQHIVNQDALLSHLSDSVNLRRSFGIWGLISYLMKCWIDIDIFTYNIEYGKQNMTFTFIVKYRYQVDSTNAFKS